MVGTWDPHHNATYAMNHLSSESIVLCIIPRRQQIVSTWVEAHSIVPVSALVGTADMVHTLYESRVAGHQLVRSDTRNVAYCGPADPSASVPLEVTSERTL